LPIIRLRCSPPNRRAVADLYCSPRTAGSQNHKKGAGSVRTGAFLFFHLNIKLSGKGQSNQAKPTRFRTAMTMTTAPTNHTMLFMVISPFDVGR
jgi:hypothetical protein